MDSPQSLFEGSSVLAEPEKKNNNGVFLENKEEAAMNYIGVLDVHVHQARDILNICIYHKQDVYAKICLTSDPENAVSTQTINGGGKNPVFNQTLRLNVPNIECSLKCEIWMMSRVRNYLEDQLLGFALVPLSEVLVGNGKLEKEFTLSSTDLFHSPSGFVQLSLAYTGASPEVLVVPAPPNAVTASDDDKVVHDSEAVESLSSEFEKIEFPDPKIVNENHLMVSEYFGIQCENLDSQSSSDTENQSGSQVKESVLTEPIDSPPSSVSTNGSVLGSHPANSQSSDMQNEEEPREFPKEKTTDSKKENSLDAADSESLASGNLPKTEFPKPLVSINVPETNVVQQDIVDMYMKSMQQFTESLAKMKLPLDIESAPSSSGNSSSDQKSETPKSAGSRVFYGSRAFF
ncbi:PREDICTED: uncharacterized protein LOC109178173 [Ipomoea nil]|uniref:uncharacterized protein LOC109178173 n=1 Tax=Ipomoea nil TaxID=35883 RepID=UPI000900984C|nr:PREDICTED: uncharacterized protein LOC109178173 [Ipomoea nil]